MKVFVAGGSGAIGRHLIPMLVEAGHSVVALVRTPEKGESIRAAGAEPVIGDLLDEGSVRAAVRDAAPETVVHQATALSGLSGNPRRFDREFTTTNRLRTEGTDHLLRAAREAGARRLIAQSFGGWPYVREGAPVKTEDDPLDPNPPAAARESLAAIRYMEASVTGAEGVEGFALRYGGFYGPGTGLARGEESPFVDTIRKRRFPILDGGTGVWSFVQIQDAARATVAAVERGAPGIYNVVDDDPAPVAEWLPALAEALDAKPPRRLPVWLGRIVGGELAVSLMTQVRGASNAKAKRELGWQLEFPSWREGFRTGFG
jgi:nucleoside-diphosphate-sugar epimerase